MKHKFLISIMVFVLAVGMLCACSQKDASIEVVFDLGYDGATTFTQDVKENRNIQMPDNPVREGYVFEGWFEKSASGEFKAEPFDFVENTVSEAFTLYAKWSEEATDMQMKPKEPKVSYVNGMLQVDVADDCEVSFNDGNYSGEKTFACDYASRVKISIRKKETSDMKASEIINIFYTVKPNVKNFSFKSPSDVYETVTVNVKNSALYEYKFEGTKKWQQGTKFDKLLSKAEQKVRIRVCGEGEYPPSESVEKSIVVNIDTDTDFKNVVSYIWGGSTKTGTISQNTKKEGLCGSASIRSIKIKDKDITSFNDYAVRIPNGYDAFSADVKVTLNTRSAITKDLPLTNGTGRYLGAIKIGEWQKVYASGSDWIVTFAFPELIGGQTNPAGTATIYLDNIVFYTKAEVENGSWNPTRLVEDSIGTGDADAITDMVSKFDITLGTANSLYKNFKSRYIIQTVASQENAAHMIKVKATKIKNISSYNGISFAVDMQMAGGKAGGKIPLYLVKKGISYTKEQLKNLTDFSDTSTFTKIHTYKVDMVGGTFNGSEIVTISAQELKAAGYDLTNLNDLTFVFRDVEQPATGGWWNIYNMYFYDFKCY